MLTTALAGCADDAPAGPRPLTCNQPIEVTSYRVDAVAMPASPSEAEDLGADLDGDDTVDNQIGNVLSAIFSALGADPGDDRTPPLAGRLAGDVDWRLERSTCPASGESRLALADDTVPLGLLIDILGGGDPGWTDASGSRIWFAADDTGLRGQISTALDLGYQDVFAEVYARVLTDRSLRRDEFDSPDVDELIDRLDLDGDREISEAELRASSVFVTLLRPDLDSDDGGVPDRMSLGLGFHATAVSATP